jgi:galactose mutarotase-like enzyme
MHPYLAYVLFDSKSRSTLEVVPERGGMVTRWQVLGEDILYMDWDRFRNPELSVRGGIPLLFPICGNLPNDTYQYRDRTYTLTQHGFARNLPWEVIDASSSSALTLRLQSHEHTLDSYPFIFECTITYSLSAHALTIQQDYINQGTQPMPFSSGLHPYFAVRDKSQLQFLIPATQYLDQRTREVAAFSGTFDWDCDEIDWAFTDPTAQLAKVIDRDRNVELTMAYDRFVSTLVFWTQKGKDFYCLEPWSAPRNALNTGTRLSILEPGDTMHSQVTFKIQSV